LSDIEHSELLQALWDRVLSLKAVESRKMVWGVRWGGKMCR